MGSHGLAKSARTSFSQSLVDLSNSRKNELMEKMISKLVRADFYFLKTGTRSPFWRTSSGTSENGFRDNLWAGCRVVETSSRQFRNSYSQLRGSSNHLEMCFAVWFPFQRAGGRTRCLRMPSNFLANGYLTTLCHGDKAIWQPVFLFGWEELGVPVRIRELST